MTIRYNVQVTLEGDHENAPGNWYSVALREAANKIYHEGVTIGRFPLFHENGKPSRIEGLNPDHNCFWIIWELKAENE